MQRWEKSAHVRVIKSETPSGNGVVEVNMHHLTRDVGACVAMPLMHGQDFLDRDPGLLDDFWRFDNDLFLLRMLGISEWAPFNIIKKGLAARERLIDAAEGLVRRIDQYTQGQPVDYGADMSDVSTVSIERNAIYREAEFPYRERAVSEFTLLWGQNANSKPMIFWLLLYTYSTSGLVCQLRKETAPYLELSQSTRPELMSMNLAAISRDCPLLKASVFETYRMANEAASICQVSLRVTIDDGQLRHELRPRTFVTAPHSIRQLDPAVYADPDEFMPTRFLETDLVTSKQSARYRKLKPWGAGPLCARVVSSRRRRSLP